MSHDGTKHVFSAELSKYFFFRFIMHIGIVVQVGRKPRESLLKELHRIKQYKMQQ